MKTDVLVIGGGPAGSAAAVRLTQIGMKVRLYEKTLFPRPKLCGGFMSPECLEELDQIGVLDSVRQAGAHTVTRTLISAPSGSCVEAPLPAVGLSLSREVLDALLLQRARDSGVAVLEGDGYRDPSGAPWTIVAAGRRANGSLPYYGLQAFFENVPGITDQVELDIVKTGYVGWVRQEGGRINLCALTTKDVFRKAEASLDGILEIWRRQNPLLDERLRQARRISRWMTIGPVSMGIRQLAQPGRLFVGDAACVVDPFAGEGIAMAQRSAVLIQKAFSQSKLPIEQAYARSWHLSFDSALRYDRWMRFVLRYRWLHESMIFGLKTFPPLLTWITTMTRPHENVQPYPDRRAV